MKNTGPQRAKLDTLKPNPKNPRVIKDDKFQKLVQSIRAFPQMLEVRPIVCTPDGVVLGGNMRLRACKEAGLREVPVHVVSWLDSQQEEFIIKDNVGFGEWDWDILANEWDAAQLEDWGLDVWTPEEEPTQGLTDPDDVPEVPEEPKTQPGDLYLLGDHRLLCGDSTKAEDVERLMNGERADIWLTDPPYNIAYEGGSKKRDIIKNDEMSDSDFFGFLVLCFTTAHNALRPGGAFYIFHADTEGLNFRVAANDVGLKVRQVLIWKKNNSAFGRSDYHWKHEPCLYGWKDGAPHSWHNDRKQTTVLEFDRPSRSAEHPTMKPVELIQYCMSNSSLKGQIVLDSFLGSGTTLIAAEKTGRKCYGMELDPKYCDVIVKRWEEFTGLKATKEAPNVLTTS